MENIISSIPNGIQHIQGEPNPVNSNHINVKVVPPKDVQIKDLLINDVKNKINPSSDYISDNSSEYESAGSTKSSSTLSVNEIVNQEMAEKAVTPNILGNALKAMKNLFSPDKPRSKPLNASTPATQKEEEEIVASNAEEKKMDLLDVSALTARLSSISLESSSNVTDDSFITTYSRVDDSFQSTFTHLGDQNLSDPMSCNDEEEEEKINKTFVEIPIDLNLDLSCNETSAVHDNLENTVLMKKDSLDDSAELKEVPNVLEPAVAKLGLENNNSPIVLEGKHIKCSTPIGDQSIICLNEEKMVLGDIKIKNEVEDELKNKTFDVESDVEICNATFDVEETKKTEENIYKINNETFDLGKKGDLKENHVDSEELKKDALNYLSSVERIEEALMKDFVEGSKIVESSEKEENLSDLGIKESSGAEILSKTIDLETNYNLNLPEVINSPQEENSESKIVENSDVNNKTLDLDIKENLDSKENPSSATGINSTSEEEFSASPDSIESSEFINKTFDLEVNENFLAVAGIYTIPEEEFSASPDVNNKFSEIVGSPELLNKTFELENPALPDSTENSSPLAEPERDFAVNHLQKEENLVLQESKIVEKSEKGKNLDSKENFAEINFINNFSPASEINEKISDLPKSEEKFSAAPEMNEKFLEKTSDVPDPKENVSVAPEINEKISDSLEPKEDCSAAPVENEKSSEKISDMPELRENFLAASEINGKFPKEISDSLEPKENFPAAPEINEKSSEENPNFPAEGKSSENISILPELKGNFLAALEINEKSSEKNSDLPEPKENFPTAPKANNPSSEKKSDVPESGENFLNALEINGKSSGKNSDFSESKEKISAVLVANNKSTEEILNVPESRNNFPASTEINGKSSVESGKNGSATSEIDGKASEKNSNLPELKQNLTVAPVINEKSSEQISDLPGRKDDFLASPDKSFEKISHVPDSKENFPATPEINGESPEENSDLSESKENFLDALDIVEKTSDTTESGENFSAVLEIKDKTLNFEIKEIAEKIQEKNKNLNVEEVIQNNFSSDEIKVSTLNVELVNEEKFENLNSTVIEVKTKSKKSPGKIAPEKNLNGEKFEFLDSKENNLEARDSSEFKISPKPNLDNSKIYSPNSVALLDSSIHSELEKFQKGETSFSIPEINKNEQINPNPETNLIKADERLIKTNSMDSKFDFLNRNNTEEDLISGIKGLKLDDSFRLTEDFLDDKLSSPSDKSESDITQFIQEQFTANDIEKICSVVEELPVINVNRSVMRASQLFEKSIHERFPEESEFTNSLSPEGLDFLDSIQGKSCGRDFSRESLYVKFDPLVESKPKTEVLLQISPPAKQQPVNVVAPLTPVTRKKETPDESNLKIKELQQEIEKLTRLISERENANQEIVNDYENQIAKFTGQTCLLEDKLRESREREKSLVRKLRDQRENISQLQLIMEEYTKIIAKLTKELSDTVSKNKEEVDGLKTERDSYMTHLQNTEAAFSDVHVKYEKSKKTIEYHREKEAIYKNTIAEQSQLIEDHKEKAMEIKEKAVRELNKIHNEMDEMKLNHAQETSRVRAQLRKTELKVQALQESLEQKIKENKELTTICDDLIAGKK